MVAYLAGRYSGLRSFGARSVCCSARCSSASRWVRRVRLYVRGHGSYVDVLWVSVGCNVLAILLMAALGPFPDWASNSARVSVLHAPKPALLSVETDQDAMTFVADFGGR